MASAVTRWAVRMGVGALLARRDATLVPLTHGGGQERQVRSGTLDVPAIRGFAAAMRHAAANRERGGRAAGCPARQADSRCPGGRLRNPGERRLAAGRRHAASAGQRPPARSRLRRRRPALAAGRRRHRVLDRLRLPGRRAAAQPRAAGHGHAGGRPAAPCGSPSDTPRPRPTSTRSSRHCRRPSSGPAGPGDTGPRAPADS